MNDLLRELAPVSGAAWQEIETEARRTLETMLAARKLVDFNGPLGWDAGAVNLGRTRSLEHAPQPGVEARLRRMQPLVELRVPFELSREELEAVTRGAKDVGLDPVREAARAAALAEDRAVFHGYAEAGISGIVDASAKSRCSITEDYGAYLGSVAEALHKLRVGGIGGPYAIALGPRCFTGLSKTMLGGFPALEQLRRLLDGPIVPAPAVDGAVLLSLRGGDFELTVGQDFSIGYLDHTPHTVRLYLQESMTFRVLAAEAAVPLAYVSS
ncbi:MAG: bacteriocin family protein [Burkholderiales bacterium]|nr:bacteriocin family protein [Burkholderiales bacterium]